MPGKEGGKAKPLKKAKGKQVELDDDDLAFKAKQKADAEKLKALKAQVAGKGFGGAIRADPRTRPPRLPFSISISRSRSRSHSHSRASARDRRRLTFGRPPLARRQAA